MLEPVKQECFFIMLRKILRQSQTHHLLFLLHILIYIILS